MKRGSLLKVRPRDGCKWTWENKSPLRSSASLSEGGTGVTVGKQLIGKFKIEGSNDNSKWTLIHQSEDKQAEGFPQDTVVTLENR